MKGAALAGTALLLLALAAGPAAAAARARDGGTLAVTTDSGILLMDTATGKILKLALREQYRDHYMAK